MNSARLGILALIFTAALWGQNVSGTIRGEVVDPGNAAVVNANVTLTRSDTGAALRATTNVTGIFVFPSVAAGVYRLEVESPGFRKYIRTGIALTASEGRPRASTSPPTCMCRTSWSACGRGRSRPRRWCWDSRRRW